MKAEAWILHYERKILVTDCPGGPPASICVFMSEEAKKAAEARGYSTVSEIGFPKDCFLGSFDLSGCYGWGEAGKVAEAKAKELGYAVEYNSILAEEEDKEEDKEEWDDDEARWEDQGWEEEEE